MDADKEQEAEKTEVEAGQQQSLDEHTEEAVSAETEQTAVPSDAQQEEAPQESQEGDSAQNQVTGEQSAEEQASTEPAGEQTSTEPTAEQTSTEPTAEQTSTEPTAEQASTEPTTEQASTDPTAEEQSPAEPTTEQSQAESGSGETDGKDVQEDKETTENQEETVPETAEKGAGGEETAEMTQQTAATEAGEVEKADTEPQEKSEGTSTAETGEKAAAAGEAQAPVQEQAERAEEVKGEGQVEEAKKSEDQPDADTKTKDEDQAKGDEKTKSDGNVTETAPTGEAAPASEAAPAAGETTPADGMAAATRGDEDEIASDEVKHDDDEPKIPDDFYYNTEEHISQAKITEESGLPNNLLTLHHSFGYDCKKRANLHMLDSNTVAFAAGNVVELLDLSNKQQTYMRTTSGGGLGALTVHPSRKYLAVAEKGSAPNINIYEYPSLKLFRILRGGTQEAYSYVDFSPDGKLLASVGGDPDYMLTLWDWKQEKIVLRSKAFSQDVFRVTFSTELEGQLTSAGTGHVRFWKMASTFTGLKLQGQLGKFGKTEISDIEGYVELPDGKVLSGAEWGNMLLWDGGLIKVEISRKNHKPCHHGPIQQIVMDEGELMTIGVDGYIRVWDFETIDTADVTDESAVFEMEPMNELRVGSDVQLKSIIKSVNEDEPTMWYAQDSNGGIWKLDLSFSHTSMAPEKLMSYHAGEILGCDTSPVSHLVATTGVDRTVRVFDYLSKKQLCESRFNAGGSCLLWAPQVVDPKGSTIITGFEDGVVRVLTFSKHEHTEPGKKAREVNELELYQAFKPHNGKVTCVAIDSKAEILASGGDDSSVFFMSIGKTYEAIGFIKTPSAVTHLEWSPAKFEKNTLLVCCLEGQVLEVSAPEPGQFDTSHTYQINGLKIRSHDFKSVKSRLRHEEELARKAIEEEARKKKEEEERRIRIERGLETESDADELEKEENKTEEEDWKPFIPSEPSPILYGFHSSEPGKFWLSMGEFDAGYFYEYEFLDEGQKATVPEDELYEPVRAIPIENSGDLPIQVMAFNHDSSQLIMGMHDGSVRVQSVEEEKNVAGLGSFWSLTVHDNHYGHITRLATSFDGCYLFTVGADGNFFTFQIMDQAELEKTVAENKAKIPSARKEDIGRRVEDIEDHGAYSIEDAKQKMEYDKMMKAAEEKKQGVRRTVADLRRQFRKLLEKNGELPKHLQLERKEFEMDPEIKKELQRQTQEKIEIVEKEMAWEAEKHRIALEKLRFRFRDVIQCDRIVLKAFLTDHEVSSFRASKLPEDFFQAKAELERRRNTTFYKDDPSRDPTSLLKGQTHISGSERSEQAQREATEAKIMTTLKGSMGERINKALQKVEEKKRKRAVRRGQWAELNGSKPDDDYEDPKDVADIKEAQENMGDYKLKSADDYVVPDHLRMNVEKARARLLVLKELIHKYRDEFNERLLHLRDKKLGIIEEFGRLVVELQEVQGQLSSEHHVPLPEVPRMYPQELPEKKFEYTRDLLLNFKKSLAARKAAELKGVESTGFGGFGGAGAAPTAVPAQKQGASPSPSHPSLKHPSQVTAAESVSNTDLMSDVTEPEPSPLELQIRQAEQIRLLYQRDDLLRRMDDVLKNFDAELRCLRHDKFKLDVDLKNAELRQVTLFEELLLLREFEKRENILASKVENKQQEKLDMQAKVIDVQQKLEVKKKDIEKLLEKEKSLNATFVQSLGENNKFVDYLTKVFKKKIKRSKKKATEGMDSDEDSDEDSDSDEDWSESDEESDSETGGYDLDVCPSGCDQNLYDNTCTLREKRLDLEEALSEEKKNSEALKKELENLTKRTGIIDSGLKAAENELEAFQLEKQRKLNELDIVVTMKLHQIQYMLNGILPQDLTPTLVFAAPEVVRLQHRIKELETEKAMQKKQQKEAKKKHVQLIKDRRVFAHKIEQLDEMCQKMMLQKFGRIVDLEKLETVTVNRNIEELKEKLRNTEIQCSNDILKWEEMISESKDEITNLIRENTNRLDSFNMLFVEKKDYQISLDSRQKNLGSEFSGARKADIHERKRLIQLVQLQAQEIEALKEEITLLSQKGGHILPPAQPPLPQVPQQ